MRGVIISWPLHFFVLRLFASAPWSVRHKLFFHHTVRSFGAESCGTLLTIRISSRKNPTTSLFRMRKKDPLLVPNVHFLKGDQSEALTSVNRKEV